MTGRSLSGDELDGGEAIDAM